MLGISSLYLWLLHTNILLHIRENVRTSKEQNATKKLLQNLNCNLVIRMS